MILLYFYKLFIMSNKTNNNGINNIWVIFAIVILVIWWIFFFSNNSNDTEEVNTSTKQVSVIDENQTINKTTKEVSSWSDVPEINKKDEMETKVMNDDTKLNNVAATQTLVKWTYADFKESSIKNDWDVVLFFHATWCPSCNAADKELKSSEIPDGLTVLKTDYDSNLDLRKKYWVTSQHTFVQVDNSWNKINKWSWWQTVASIKENLK